MTFSQKNSCELPIPFEHREKRLDVFLAQSMEFEAILGRKLSRSEIARGIRNGGVAVCGRSVKPSFFFTRTVSLEVFPEQFTIEDAPLLPEADLSISVIEEHEHFLIIDKSAGIQVHPSVSRENGTVVNWIIAHYQEIRTVGDSARPGIVHRLDRDTSGLLVIARTKRSFTALKKLFKDRKIKKCYLALVFGIPKEKEGIITTPIARSARGDRQRAVLPGRRVKGIIRPAETHYRVLQTFENTSLVEIEPRTGRTHQIRVHLSSIGHPVLGDTLYASRSSRELSIGRSYHLLHAAALSFTLFGQKYSFESPLPKDFKEALALYKSEKSE